jgi:hypothetical protein
MDRSTGLECQRSDPFILNVYGFQVRDWSWQDIKVTAAFFFLFVCEGHVRGIAFVRLLLSKRLGRNQPGTKLGFEIRKHRLLSSIIIDFDTYFGFEKQRQLLPLTHFAMD